MRFLFILLFLILHNINADDKEKQYLFLGNHNIPPMIYIQDGKPEGLVIDLTNAIAKEAGIDIKIDAMDWTKAQEIVYNDKADALLQINSNPQRAKIYNFSKPLLKSDFCIFHKNTRTDIKNINSLFGKTVAVESKGYPISLLKKYPKVKIKIISNWKEGFELIKSNKIDALVVDRWVGEYILSINKIEGISIVDKPIESSYSAIAVKKENQELLNKINEALDNINTNGTREKILNKWSSKEVVYITKEKYVQLNYTAIISTLLFILLLIFYILKIQRVNKKLKINQENLKQLNSTLEERVKEEIEKNRQHEFRLHQNSKMIALGEMLQNIAHQWRQPLSIITTNISALQADIDFGEKITDEKILKCADGVIKQSKYLSKTIDDFRNYFSSEVKIKKEYPVSDIMENLNLLVESALKNNFITYNCTMDENIKININQNLLIQALINIINNSKDAIKENIEDTDLRFIFIKTTKDDKNITISIKDSGGGIDKDVIGKIFEPYFTTKHPSVGTGIGLYMTYEIITKQLGGTIEVSNSEYRYDNLLLKGAEFKIKLPLE